MARIDAVGWCKGMAASSAASSIGYDDEIVRFAAWRNLLPPYEREFKRDNARFDLLAAFRFAWATGRRDGIEWPTYEDGAVSLSLGDLHRRSRSWQGDVRFLICTDVAARGLDIKELPYVINMTL